MALTVLRISQTDHKQIDVIGEFESQDQADKFAEDSQFNDVENDFEFVVESPPSHQF